MQYVIVITHGADIVGVVGRWSMSDGAEAWLLLNEKSEYEYKVMKMYHPDLYE